MASNWLVAQPPTRSSDRKWMSSGRDFDMELTMLVMPLPRLPLWQRHMTVMVTRISGQSSVCSTVFVDWQQRNIKGLCYCPFVLGIHWCGWIPHTKGQCSSKCHDIHIHIACWATLLGLMLQGCNSLLSLLRFTQWFVIYLTASLYQDPTVSNCQKNVANQWSEAIA